MAVSMGWSLGLGEGRACSSYVLFILLGGVPVAFGRVTLCLDKPSGPSGPLGLGEGE